MYYYVIDNRKSTAQTESESLMSATKTKQKSKQTAKSAKSTASKQTEKSVLESVSLTLDDISKAISAKDIKLDKLSPKKMQKAQRNGAIVLRFLFDNYGESLKQGKQTYTVFSMSAIRSMLSDLGFNVEAVNWAKTTLDGESLTKLLCSFHYVSVDTKSFEADFAVKIKPFKLGSGLFIARPEFLAEDIEANSEKVTALLREFFNFA